MNRAHRSQVRELLLQLTDLKDRLNATYRDTGEDLEVREGIAFRKALAEIDSAIIILTGVI